MIDHRANFWAIVVAILICLLVSPVHSAEDPFPQYPVIEPNVSFWTMIYSHYATDQAVVHDSLHMDIIYDVIALKPDDYPGARKINRRRMKQATRHVTGILKRLAADPSSQDAECRRVAALFGDRANARTFNQARHNVRCQIGQSDRFRAGLIRSGAYIDRIRAILKSEGVPEDLAYLPHVESSFNTNAYSKFGAAGMWQFTRSTGRRFMTVDYVIDERRDPIAATHAAARLLKENYDKLGSWPLAITAYNHGARGMQRAKATHGDYPEVFTSYKGRTFKFASRNFYSEFLAARRVASDYRRYFGELPLKPPVSFGTVRLEGYAPLADLCRHFNVSADTIRTVNPALRPPVFSGQKFIPDGYLLHLPAGTLSDGLLLADIPADLLKPAQKRSRFYTVQRGDTAGKIASMHRVSLNDLILANDLDRRATVYVHQTLRIPQAGESPPDLPKQPRTEPIETVVLTASAKIPPAEPSLPAAVPLLSYRRPGPAPADLLAMADNATDAEASHSGNPPATVSPAVLSLDVGFYRITTINRQPVGIIEVQVEETLGHYAEWAGIRASRIRHLNKLPFGQPLKLHQQVKIPLSDVPAEDFEARRYEYHKRLQEDFFAAYRVGDLQRYRVQPGDSYWSLCHDKFDLPLWLLKQYNSEVNLAALRVHQSLTIPSVESLSDSNPDGGAQTAMPDA